MGEGMGAEKRGKEKSRIKIKPPLLYEAVLFCFYSAGFLNCFIITLFCRCAVKFFFACLCLGFCRPHNAIFMVCGRINGVKI